MARPVKRLSLPDLNSVIKALKDLPAEHWTELEIFSKARISKLSKMEWIHNKYYRRNTSNSDGCLEQLDEKDRKEIPYNRELFWPTNGRFGLGKKLVAYFSSDFGTNCCEVTKTFRKSISKEDLHTYFQGNSDPEPDLMGYPISVALSEQAAILDLTNESLSFFVFLGTLAGWPSSEEFISSVIRSRESSIYPLTQAISIEAKSRGYDGICYRSVRGPTNLSLPDLNLVVFNKSVIVRKCFPPN